MFKIIENKNFADHEMDYPFHVSLNDKIIEGIGAREVAIFNKAGEIGNGYEIEAFDEQSRFLGEYGIDEFSEVSQLYLYSWNTFDDFQLNVLIYFNYGYDSFFIEFQIIPNFSHWKRQFSFAEYSEVFHTTLLGKFAKWEFLSNINPHKEFREIQLTTTHTFGDKSINQELSEFEMILLKIHKETIEYLKSEHLEDSINATFNFPKEIKSNCEQYLLYFATFLRDLGIKATPNLKEEAGKVLFSVTPTNDIEALDKIREALAIYLNLPSSPIVYDDSFAAMRLQQQVENLQHSQKMAVREIRSADRELRLAQTVIEHQDKIIYQKDSIIEQQNKVIEKIQSKSIMMDSLENKEEFEKVFEGLEVGESKILKEQIGIRFNPVTSLKTLGKKFLGKDNEKKSVLGLDEED